jgi:hypothetical protein
MQLRLATIYAIQKSWRDSSLSRCRRGVADAKERGGRASIRIQGCADPAFRI